MTNVLVTGVTGFIGSHLLESLKAQGRYHLVGMIRNQQNQQRLENLGVEVRVADLLNPASLQGVTRDIDTVIHLAARMRFHDPWKSSIPITWRAPGILLWMRFGNA